MTGFDYAVLTILGVSVVVSVMRGLVHELFALAGWVVAFVTANLFGETVSLWLPASITGASLRLLVAFVVVFILSLLVMGLLARLLRKLVHGAGMSVEDRVLGGVFGLARGLLVVLLAVLLAGLTNLPRQPVWNNAMLSAPLEALAVFVKPWLPQYLAQRITYD